MAVLLLAGMYTLQRDIDALRARVDRLAGAVVAAEPSAPGAAVADGAGSVPRWVGAEPAAAAAANATPGARPEPQGQGPAHSPVAEPREIHWEGIKVIDPAAATEQLRSALVDMLDSDDPDLQTRLRAVVRDQRELERDARRAKRQTRWEEDTLGRLAMLSDQVGLDQIQQDTLFSILSRARDLTGEAFREAREDHSFGDAREKAARFRKEADDEARELLSDGQFGAYETMRNEEMDRRGIRRGH